MEVNEAIRDRELRVIGHDGKQMGLMSYSEAIELANRQELDLVKIAPNALPPVCKIMDYGKYCFDLSKKSKEARKKQHISETKEIRLSSKIDIHDFNTKVNHAIKFLKNGSKIKVSMRFRGREMGHSKIGYEVMKRFSEACSEFSSVERSARMDGRIMLMFLSSNIVVKK